MKRNRLMPSPAMVVAIMALVFSMAGASYAALAKNSVTSRTVKNNSLTSNDIRNSTVKSKDIRNRTIKAADVGLGALTGLQIADGTILGLDLGPNSVDGGKVADNSLSGADIDEGTLGQVPSAANADRLGGRQASGYVSTETLQTFKARLSFGESRYLVSNGPVALVAQCRENVNDAGQDELRLLAVTTEPGAFMQGDTPHGGPGVASDHLNPDTPEESRILGGIVSTAPAGEGQPAADDDIDTGFVAGPNGHYIGTDETTMYALRVGGADCLIAGSAVVL